MPLLSIVRLTGNISYPEKMSDIQCFRHFFVEHFHNFASQVCHFFVKPLSMFHRHFVIGSSDVCQICIAIAMKQCFSSEPGNVGDKGASSLFHRKFVKCFIDGFLHVCRQFVACLLNHFH
jgi:hypothetical protein